ncbi:MAG: SUMF1/EgtB/PvdO family nonheme iron enzyme [Verrucomicrobia bacterium]|nr:SUMF1/EgtB/PvdO family nonheme iron enzyme [Verrucomicrobiota bacterium]
MGLSGKKFTLPTEAQWEWACRAGTDLPFFYGNRDTDFARFANLADSSLGGLQRGDSPAWHPKDGRFNDGAMVTANVGRYQPNAWGLHDMHGNAAEWTVSSYRPYPYDDHDGRNAPNSAEMKTVRAGSWCDRPIHAGSASQLPWSNMLREQRHAGFLRNVPERPVECRQGCPSMKHQLR